MIYPECDRNAVPVPNHHLHQPSTGIDQSHQHLNLLHNHLNNAEYAAAISALSPKYNTAFNVTNLLNPVLEDTYRKQHQHHQQQQQQQQQIQQHIESNFQQSYPNRANMNSSGSSSTPSSTTSSSSSVKQESPSMSLGVHANMCNSYQPAGSPDSFSPNMIQPSPNSSAPPLQTPYFNYAATNQFSNSLVGPPVSHYAAAAAANPYSHYYNTSPYCSNAAAAAAAAAAVTESDSYSSQLQYANNSTWYSTNANDPRFTSKHIS